MPRQERGQPLGVRLAAVHGDIGADSLPRDPDHRVRVLVRHAVLDLKILDKRVEIRLFERLFHARRHRVIEVRHALAAVHFVLVRLDCDAGERRVAADVVRLAQIAVAGGEAAVKQPDEVDLAAGLGERVEILIVDVDIALGVRLRDFRRNHVFVVEALRTLRAVFEHCAHRGIGVDVRVLALDIGVLGGLEGEILIDLHKLVVHLAQALMLCAVEDVRLRRLRVIGSDQPFLHDVLNLLDGRDVLRILKRGDDLPGQAVKVGVAHALRGDADIRLEYGVSDFFRVKGNLFPVALDNILNHADDPFYVRAALCRAVHPYFVLCL